jgi:CheY-like chemotaxis protein/anti-sigma regulatory factor (Ser/Thr protein kinase)
VKKNIGLVVECQEELPFLMADQRRVRQILANLLSNAVKFTPEAGQVGLRVTQELDHIRFSVTDSGIGISAEDQKKLFKPFIQLDSRLSRQYNGTGLGLSLVSRLTELHGGKVELESAAGAGCCFSVILPLISATLDQTETQLEPHLLERSAFERSHVSTTAPLVLLTEDNAATRESIETYLIASGYQLVHAASGKEAIEKAEELHPAVILMDIQMAEMDGFEAMRILRQRPATAKIPIVALTALAMSGDRERCLEAGESEKTDRCDRCPSALLHKLNLKRPHVSIPWNLIPRTSRFSSPMMNCMAESCWAPCSNRMATSCSLPKMG